MSSESCGKREQVGKSCDAKCMQQARAEAACFSFSSSECMPSCAAAAYSMPSCSQHKENMASGPLCNSSSSAPASLISLPETKQSELEQDVNGDEDEFRGGCATPKAPEHRIPDLPLICPPPPHKKRRRIKHAVGMIDQITVAVTTPFGDGRHNITGPSFFSPPSDLHTYPEIIRALFKD